MPEIRQVDPHDDAALRGWFEVKHAGEAEGRVHPLLSAYEEIAVNLRSPSPNFDTALFAAVADGEVLGALRLDFPLKENRNLANWELAVAPAHRREGVGTALFEHGHRHATGLGRSVHCAEVNIPAGATPETFGGSLFAAKFGFVTEHEENRFVLDLPLAALGELRASAPADGYTFVSWSGACPDEHIGAYAVMRTTMSNEVPTGTLGHEPVIWDEARLRTSEERLAASGFTSITTAARAADGAFAGYSLMFVPGHRPSDVYQDDTLVIAGHRGHRLGAAMKVRNLEILEREHPASRRVHTWTAGSNDAMRHVNAAFGFRPVELMHEVQRED
ncbi:GNAT family N-acetyltransferase [Actinorhabdospora filicis]|uniref:GNAT family N-acetyltransferase n=1 Tax=Actinorhabdospora filicis TaxID=1785913 RepID=A0A9W6SHA1_9ACTN|nr:GNAT family N-acetyltransferase [Actinorhabdospora filicis]GLZ75414.1 GNAT family N-acetyltransferase [Actinorhabdospora filicis]